MKFLAFIGICAALSVPAAIYGQPLIHDNSDAVMILATVLTVFAGFLVGIMAVLGDPAMTPDGSWRIAEGRHPRVQTAVVRHTTLFYLYLLAIGLLFVGVLLSHTPRYVGNETARKYIEMAYLFVGIWSFLLTLALPTTLARIQLDRSAAEIERRRANEGIKPSAS